MPRHYARQMSSEESRFIERCWIWVDTWQGHTMTEREQVDWDAFYQKEPDITESDPAKDLFRLDRCKAALRVLPRGHIASLLDVGCGDGVFCQWIGSQVAVNRLAGVDVSTVLLERAKRRCPGVELHLGKLPNLPFADNEFQVVTLIEVRAPSRSGVGASGDLPRIELARRRHRARPARAFRRDVPSLPQDLPDFRTPSLLRSGQAADRSRTGRFRRRRDPRLSEISVWEHTRRDEMGREAARHHPVRPRSHGQGQVPRVPGTQRLSGPSCILSQTAAKAWRRMRAGAASSGIRRTMPPATSIRPTLAEASRFQHEHSPPSYSPIQRIGCMVTPPTAGEAYELCSIASRRFTRLVAMAAVLPCRNSRS